MKCLVISFLIVFVCCKESKVNDRIILKPSLLPDSISTGLVSILPDAGPFFILMDSIAASLSSATNIKIPDSAISILSKTIYVDNRMVFDSYSDNLDNVLPQKAWKNHKGGCLGVGFIFLLLGEKLNLPIYGVLLPGHFFVRWDDGKTQINIEPNLNGYNHDDGYYRERYGVKSDKFYNLRNLTKKECLSVLSYGIGTCYLKTHKPDKAAQFFSDAAFNFPDFAEANGNLAISEIALHDTTAAFQAYRNAEKARPNLVNLSFNIGMIYLNKNLFDSARAEFDKGLFYFPTDTLLLKGKREALRNLDIN